MASKYNVKYNVKAKKIVCFFGFSGINMQS